MPITVVVGGQFGSEGKGKVAHYWAKESNAEIAVRVGGPNSGHSVVDSLGIKHILKQLPTASLLSNVVCVLGAGSYIKPSLLFEEIEKTGLSTDRLLIDPNAYVINDSEEQEENSSDLRVRIGSTQSGTGAAVGRRVARGNGITFASQWPDFSRYVKPVIPYLRRSLLRNERIILEGTQGFGLSLLHSNCYPYVTSRDTSASAFVAEVGLSPLDVDEIVMVLRSFPIRVSGSSGPLPREITWQDVTEISGSKSNLIEYTSVTDRVRRVAEFDSNVVQRALEVNSPTHLVMNHMDYVDSDASDEASPKIREFVDRIEADLNRQIDFLGFGPASLIRISDEHFCPPLGKDCAVLYGHS